MSKGKKPKLPPAPSAQELIGQQAQANRVDQTTPFGSVSYSGPYRSNLEFTLTPQLQALLDERIGLAQAGADEASGLVGAADFSPVSAQDTTAVAQALFDRSLGRAQPFMDRRRQVLQESLDASGNPAFGADLAPGSVSELDLLGRQENQFLSDLSLGSVIEATNQRGALLGQDIAAREGNARVAALLAGLGGVQIPGLDSFYGPQALDTVGANNVAQNAALQRAQLQQQQQSSFLGGLFDLGTAAISTFGLPGMPSFGGGSPLMSSLGRYGVF